MLPTFKSEEEADRYYEEKNGKTDVVSEEDDGGDVTLIDLGGQRFEVIDTVTLEDRNFVALIPYDDDTLPDDSDEVEFTILEIIDDEEGDECTLRTIDDDDLYTRVGDEFLRIFEEYEYEEE